jgi:hypothetical protein
MKNGFYKAGLRAEQAGQRKRWSEKSAVTKRAMTQKVSLARIPSLDGGREDDHGAQASEAYVSPRPQVPRQPV